jgi:hypothetical protein
VKKIISAFLFVGGINCIFPSFVQAINVPLRVAGATNAPIGLLKRTASEQEPGQHPQRASTPAVDMRQIYQIFYNLDVLRKDPHVRDGQVPEMATTLCQAFQAQYPKSPLSSYGEAKRSFLEAATYAGVIPAGSHGAGETFFSLLDRRFNAIPQGPLLNATQEILPVCVSLAEIVGEGGMRALVDQSVQQDGTDSALYGAFLLHASSTLLSLMEERMREENAAAEAAAASPYPLGAAGGDTRRSEEKQLEIAIASSLEEASKQAAKVAREEQEQLERVTAMGLSVLDKSMPQNAAAEAAASSPYPLGAGGGVEQGFLSEREQLEIALAISQDDWQKFMPQNAAAEAASSSPYPLGAGGGAKISSSLSPDTPYLLEPLSTDMMQAINLIFLRQSSSDGQKVSLNSSTDFDEIYIFQRFIEMCQIPFEREVIEGLKVEIDPYEAFLITLSGKKLL